MNKTRGGVNEIVSYVPPFPPGGGTYEETVGQVDK